MLPRLCGRASQVMMTKPSPLAVAASRMCSLLVTGFLLAVALPGVVSAQGLEKPAQTIDDDVTAFAFAPDGKIVYAVHRGFKTKQFDLEHDDIWLQEAGGRRRRIFVGEKFTQGNSV